MPRKLSPQSKKAKGLMTRRDRLKALVHVYNCAVLVVDDWEYGLKTYKDRYIAKGSIGAMQLDSLQSAVKAME